MATDSEEMNPYAGTGTAPPALRSLLTPRMLIILALLPLASAVNYMDRQTLASAAERITTELQLDKQQYGMIEGGFGYGFVVGSLIFGFLADIVSIRWLYPIVLTCWSLITAFTADATSFEELAALRFLLGVFEAGHWPCGVRVVRAVVSTRGRTMGNGLLQSGTSVGAIVTPLIIMGMLTPEEGSWRPAFRIIGFAFEGQVPVERCENLNFGLIQANLWPVRGQVRKTKLVGRDPMVFLGAHRKPFCIFSRLRSGKVLRISIAVDASVYYDERLTGGAQAESL